MKKAEIKALQDALAAATTGQDGASLVTLSPSALKTLEGALEEEVARKGIDRDEPPRAVAVAVHAFRLKAEALAAADVAWTLAKQREQDASATRGLAKLAATEAEKEMYRVMALAAGGGASPWGSLSGLPR
jgi:hypothetical protein